MKPERIQLLRKNLREVSDYSLAQFFAVVLDEMYRRAPKHGYTHKSPETRELKDCEPTRGD